MQALRPPDDHPFIQRKYDYFAVPINFYGCLIVPRHLKNGTGDYLCSATNHQIQLHNAVIHQRAWLIVEVSMLVGFVSDME